ncbi:MAG: DUF5996 family protein, partial [Pseudomonadota bacterium]
QFYGKQTPVHLFWHTFDLALTRFSGKKAPEIAGMDAVSKEAYSHEVISFGMWFGDDHIPEPAFYSYTYPEPKTLTQKKLLPEQAYWDKINSGNVAILKYHDLMGENHPREKLLEFFNSAYQAGYESASWNL